MAPENTQKIPERFPVIQMDNIRLWHFLIILTYFFSACQRVTITFNCKTGCTRRHAMLIFCFKGVISSIFRETFINVEFSLSFLICNFVYIRIVDHISFLHPFGLDRFCTSYLSNKLNWLSIKDRLNRKIQAKF